MKRLAIAGLLCLLAARAFAACPTTSLTFKDAAGVTQTLCFGGASGAYIPQYQILDAAGTNALGINASGQIGISNFPATQPVSGTVTANQGGTWTVQPGNTANTTAWLVTGTGGTFPVTGSVIANAGTNLNTSALALDTSVNGLLLGQGSTTSGQKGTLAIGAVTTAAPTYVTAQSDPLSLTTAGALRVDGSGVTQPVSGTVTANAGTGTFTVGGTVTANEGGAPWSQNVTQFGGVNISTGTGASGTGIPRVTISNDSSLAANQSVNLAQVGGSTTAQGGVAGSQLVEQGCAGQTVANTSIATINLASSTGTTIVTGVAAKKTYICSINIVAGAAVNVALVEGTTATCATGITGMAGGATAATGWNLAANGGLTLGNGQGLVFKTATAADNVCLLASAASQLSGSLTYAQF